MLKLPDFQQRLVTPPTHPAQEAGQAKFNRDVRDAVMRLNDKSDYQLIDVALGTTTIRIMHNLGRPWKGWDVWDRDADCRIWRVAVPAGEPSDDSKYLYLQASASVNARIMVI